MWSAPMGKLALLTRMVETLVVMRRRNGTRVLAAVLFTDIVNSTEVASRLGDARWKELIARHHSLVRRELKRFGGREFDTAGDGFFAGFKEPAAAVRCACAAAGAVRQLGIEIRAGVHFGECGRTDPVASVVFGSLRSTLYVGVDIQKEPFDDPRVRQAMNYGIDRGHVADLLGGPTSESPTCQILPPNFQGYEPFCPYTLEPDSGVWTAPDLDRAQALIKAAGAVGKEVTVYATDDPDGALATPAKRIRTMKYVAGMLNDIGLHAELKTIPRCRGVCPTDQRGRAIGVPVRMAV